MVQEARLARLETCLAPVTDGWFVVGIADAAWMTNEALGAACIFEGDNVSFPDVGFTLAVIRPGQASGMYHRGADQETFPRAGGRGPPTGWDGLPWAQLNPARARGSPTTPRRSRSSARRPAGSGGAPGT